MVTGGPARAERTKRAEELIVFPISEQPIVAPKVSDRQLGVGPGCFDDVQGCEVDKLTIPNRKRINNVLPHDVTARLLTKDKSVAKSVAILGSTELYPGQGVEV
ncbi:hypothetical protein VTO42DRAFT_8603 [Malbranchea cinnamomea]